MSGFITLENKLDQVLKALHRIESKLGANRDDKELPEAMLQIKTVIEGLYLCGDGTWRTYEELDRPENWVNTTPDADAKADCKKGPREDRTHHNGRPFPPFGT